ncbi:MAG: class I SAM-dependent RNA methyltransferase [Anaerolineales bacterium]|jgi:putative N6-adenine-specific DNA methylase
MSKITLVAIHTFGLEAIVKRELQALGFDDFTVSNGRVEFTAAPEDIPRPNIWLRSADRVLLKMSEFEAKTFDELFERTRDLSWENWITKNGQFNVTGKSVNSTLGSVRACQSIVKKAIVERLKDHYKTDWFEETGAEFTVQVALLKDTATLTIDTSGAGLNRRGYRKQAGAASLKETMAAALVQLSFYQKDRLLIDPMCGSGTILIEAALIARNIAPNLNNSFAAEDWPNIPREAWQRAREHARGLIDCQGELQLFGYDIDPEMVRASKANAKAAGVHKDIHFEQKAIQDLWIDQQYGMVISNPPYGMKLSDFKEINQIYITLNKMFRNKSGWSVYILTGDKKFPNYFKRAQPDRVRKLYNANIEVNYYQYFGERPPETELE